MCHLCTVLASLSLIQEVVGSNTILYKKIVTEFSENIYVKLNCLARENNLRDKGQLPGKHE